MKNYIKLYNNFYVFLMNKNNSCIICVFKNAYYNVGFDVFYLKNVLCDFVEELWMKYVR
jgi:hypothetical protein